MTTEGEVKAEFFKNMKLRFEKCLWPTMQCPKDPIRAHSVGKSTSLVFIEEAGHVLEMRPKIVNDKPATQFVKIGRNEASTFTGFCNQHDTQLFLPIDTKPLKLDDPEQLFLIAYRSATRELHAVMLAAVRLQTGLRTLVERGSVSGSEWSPPMQKATGALLKSWLVWRFRNLHYDFALAKADYKSILHSTYTITGRKPVLASSSFFPIDDLRMSKKTVWVALNVIPIADDETAVVFSYPKVHSGIARKRIAPVMTTFGEERIATLSNLILDSTENFFMRPSHVANWPDERRRRIEEAYFATVRNNVFLQPSPDLMLF